MASTSEQFDWRSLSAGREVVTSAGFRTRATFGLAVFLLLLLLILTRVVVLEYVEGARFRAAAAQPIQQTVPLPASRGRVLSADGAVLAVDQTQASLAVHYRYLEQPPNPRWLRRQAQRKLSSSQRRDPAQVAAAGAEVRREIDDLHARLGSLCGQSAQTWDARRRRIQRRVEHIAQRVNQRRREKQAASLEAEVSQREESWWATIQQAVREALASGVEEPGLITVREELDYHPLAESLPPDVVVELETHAENYPGVRVTSASRRRWVHGQRAAHVLGYVAPVDVEELEQFRARGVAIPADALTGKMGVERQQEDHLRGTPGQMLRTLSVGGQEIATARTLEPVPGRDVVLAIHLGLQQTAEELLDSALQRQALLSEEKPAGGAALVMDVHNGDLLAAASTPRFDPNVFPSSDSAAREALLTDQRHPLLDRTIQMALPPGSVFKVVSAAALLDARLVDPAAQIDCRGYLNRPDQWRCAVYSSRGVGHGPVTLPHALAVSCNVYFFQAAPQLGPAALTAWARQFGLGRETEIDLPGEVSGRLPSPYSQDDQNRWTDDDTRALAIGQSTLTTTPIQMVRLMAAVANGGELLTPRVVKRIGQVQSATGHATDTRPSPLSTTRIAPLSDEILEWLQDGLRRAVIDPAGTAHATLVGSEIPIAAKTGTAETSGASHAWLAGYFPSDAPKYAVVVVLEHGGSGATAAGPVVQRLAARMRELGLL